MVLKVQNEPFRSSNRPVVDFTLRHMRNPMRGSQFLKIGSIRKFIQNDVALKFSNIRVCIAISIAKYAILTQEVEWEL